MASDIRVIFIFFYLFIYFFCLLRASPVAYGSSGAKDPIGAVAAGVHHSHSNATSEPYLRPMLQLAAMPDP